MSEATSKAVDSGVPEFSDEQAQRAWWTERVHEWQASGSSQAAYTKSRNIPTTTFNWWKLRVLKQPRGRTRVRRVVAVGKTPGRRGKRRLTGRAMEAASFVPVRVMPGMGAASWWLEIACRSGRVLRLRERIELGQLSSLLTVLES